MAVAGLKLTREIMAAPALQPFTPHELKPGAHVKNDDELTQAAGDLSTTIFHPVGTCKMGNDPMAVVDDELRVRGIQNPRH